MDLKIAYNYDEFKAAGRGAIAPAFRRVGDSRIVSHYIRRCCGCDRESVVPLKGCDGEEYGYQGFPVNGNPFDLSSITLLGILHCPDCDWRGTISEGQYIESRL